MVRPENALVRGIVLLVVFGGMPPGRLAAEAGPSPLVAATGTAWQQASEQLTVTYAPKVARAGERIGDAPRVRVTRGGAPAAGIPVTLSLGTANGSVEARVESTGAEGFAVFTDVRVLGRPGPMRLVFNSPGASETAAIDLVLGPPRRIVILRQPSSRIVADVPLEVQPVVRVVDSAGNALAGVEVVARLCDERPAPAAGDRCVETAAELKGTVVARTDEGGAAAFTDLAVIGHQGVYRLDFGVLGADMTTDDNRQSIAMRYDPERESNRSHVVVSGIKSVAGQVPRDEFFDLRFRFRYTDRVFSLASVDVALANRESRDSIRSGQQFLTEAAAAMNYSVLRTRDAPTQLLERAIFVGTQLRVFNTLPYYGVHVGSVEHSRSAFQGSYFTLGILRSLSDTMNVIGADTLVSQRWSLFADFFLRSSSVTFFETLNLRAGVLFPLRRGGDLQSRITIAVPLGRIEFF